MGEVLCNYCGKPTKTTFNDCVECGLSKPTGAMMQEQIESLTRELADLKKANLELQDDVKGSGYIEFAEEMRVKAVQAEKKLTLATEALEYYEDQDNFCLYEDIDWTDNWIAERVPGALHTIGTRASETLEKIKAVGE